ncbi:MAG TPA: pentapeptide repeat-containing protein [Ktedonobacteraceae bacterium]
MDKNPQDQANHKLVTTKDKNELSEPLVRVKKSINLGFIDKSFWEWLIFLATLLGALGAIAIPIVVTIIGLNYSTQQAQSNQNIAKDQQRAAILQTYIDNIQDLLLNHNLLNSKLDEVSVLARARTLTALQGLDSKRKGQLLTFIYEAKLIGFADPNGKTHDPIIGLSGADLSGADLSGADLTNANLNSSNLYNADLTNANLSYTNLSYTNLTNVHLNSAELINANLSYANANLTNAELTNANLSYANLNGADLANADLSYAHLNGAHLNYAHLKSANLYTAHLNGAFLNDADLTVAELNNATLSNANLSEAILHAADLTNANLSDATLIYADLSGAILNNARYLTQQRLDTVRSCTKAILSTGLICHHNQ